MWQMDGLRVWQPAICRKWWAAPPSNWIATRGVCACDGSPRSRRSGSRPADRAVIAAYTRGVNFYLERNRGKYGAEFALLRYDPRPWTITDSMLGGSADVPQPDRELARRLSQKWPWRPAAIVPRSIFCSPCTWRRDRCRGRMRGPWRARTPRAASPILANDPHLEYSLPSTWYMVHLTAPGLNVTGVSLPGLPVRHHRAQRAHRLGRY